MADSLWITPKIKVLTDEAIAHIHVASLKILAEIGIRVDSDQARKIFQASPGVRFIDENRLVLQPEIVEWAIQQSPATIDIFSRKGKLVVHLGDDTTRFGIGVTNLYYQSPEDGAISPFSREHMRSSVSLGQSLDAYDFISTIGVVHDVDPARADLYAVLEMVANTDKPLIILISDEKLYIPALVMLENMTGDLSAKPFAIPYFNPVTPLILNQTTADNMISSIERGLPVIFSNYGMAGVTTPITSAGTLALLNAELLAGLVFSQLVRRGAPVVLGSLPAFFDMKTMLDFFDPQTMLLNLACAEMMAYYHIPHAGTSGSTNGYGADLIASEALSINQLTSMLGKVGLAPFIGGTLGSKVFSPEIAVYASELIEQARHFSKGFTIGEENLAFDEMNRVGVGGNFIAARQTMKLFREAYHTSSIFPRLSMEKWQEQGQPEARRYLRDRTLELLKHANPPDDRSELIRKGEQWISRFTATRR
jgi:trimethylamine---corrinoid protein Co-methyltransferase